ncbi:MAG: zinc metalloprotease HtpX [Myxococcales bacterium]
MLKNQLKTVVLLGALSALIVGLGNALAPGHLGLFAALALAMNAATYFFSDKLVLAMSRARELGPGEAPWLHEMVGDLARRAGIPKPRLYLVPELQPNAFATGRNPAHGVVAVTQGIVQALDRRELRGVLAHELAHIKNRDILISSIAAAMGSLVTYVAHALSFAAMFGGAQRDEEGEEGGSAIGGLFLALVAPIAATLVQLGISRSREYMADETGARISGDPDALADALTKLESAAQVVPAAEPAPATASLFIVNPLRGGALLSLFSTHPPMEERVRRLRAMAGATPRTTGYRGAVRWAD